MKYNPNRDIARAIRETRSFKNKDIIDWVRDHRTKKGAGGRREQALISSQSVSMWFKRHPEELAKLREEIIEKEIVKEAISESIFQNGAFYEIESIKDWILKLHTKNSNIRDSSVKNFVNAIKQVCQGQLRKRPFVVIEDWGLKHPDRLTLNDAMIYLSKMKEHGFKTRGKRLALRSFLKAKNVKDADLISGELEIDAGKYAHLKIRKETIKAIFEELKAFNRVAYEATLFGYKSGGTRITATLTAHSKDLDHQNRRITLTEKSSRGKPDRIVKKMIPDDVWEELDLDNKKGLLFPIEGAELNNILRSVYKRIIPELEPSIPMPFHFWRHQFAQHMLEATNHNYGLVARLGIWTVGTLERYYGKMDENEALNTGRKFAKTI